MNIDNLTIGEAKQLASMFGNAQTNNEGLNNMVGKKVIVRTYSAGVWFGKVEEKAGNEVIISKARRLWYWKASKEISLSSVALYGLDLKESKVCAPVDSVWLEAIELIPCTDAAIKNIEEAKNEQAR